MSRARRASLEPTHWMHPLDASVDVLAGSEGKDGYRGGCGSLGPVEVESVFIFVVSRDENVADSCFRGAVAQFLNESTSDALSLVILTNSKVVDKDFPRRGPRHGQDVSREAADNLGACKCTQDPERVSVKQGAKIVLGELLRCTFLGAFVEDVDHHREQVARCDQIARAKPQNP